MDVSLFVIPAKAGTHSDGGFGCGERGTDTRGPGFRRDDGFGLIGTIEIEQE